MKLELIVFLGLFAVLFLLKAPIWASLLLSSAAYLMLAGERLTLVARKSVAGMDSFLLMAIPMFILAAEIMNHCGVTTHLFTFANSIVGRIPGGLAHTNVMASMLFAGMSGSSAADAAGLGTMEIKAMVDDGYDAPFSAAITAASSIIGPIIPPSIPMVVYSSITGASVGKLFLGGALPGFLMGFGMMIVCYSLAKKRNYPRRARGTVREFFGNFARAIPGLMAPVILLGGIYTGVFTPTEAAAVAAVYAFILGVFAYRVISAPLMWRILVNTAVSSATICFIIGAATLFGFVLTAEQIPTRLTAGLLSVSTNPYVMLLIFNVIFLILGCFMELNAILLIFVPIVFPVAQRLGIDAVHFGVVTVVNLCIGTITPPFGMMTFISAGIAKAPLHEVFRELLPFFFILVVVLLVITYFPGMVLFLPALLG